MSQVSTRRYASRLICMKTLAGHEGWVKPPRPRGTKFLSYDGAALEGQVWLL